MSKSSKSARHSDDKNFPRKITNAPQKLIFEGNLKQLHDSRNYPASGTTKQTNVAGGKKFKSKLRSPSKPKTLQMPLGTNQVINPQTTSSKNIDKRLSLAPFPNPKHYSTMKVHEDSGDTMMTHQTKALKKEIKQNKQLATKTDENVGKEKEPKVEAAVESAVTSNTNEKSAGTELTNNASDQSTVANLEKDTTELLLSEACVQIASETENINDQIVKDQNSSNGHIEDKLTEVESEETFEKLEYKEPIVIAESENLDEEKKEADKNKEEKPLKIQRVEDEKPIEKLANEESATDQVGSTTSESSPVKNIENQANKQDHTTQAKETDDSFVSYDSNIMLKDVKIKLNDCLKDNSKLLDVTDPNASMTDALKDLSFGRTLRGISGRDSLRRMRHVTVRERLLTPNDSLFVNISGASLLQDQPQYPALNADSPYHYSSSRHDRKRKLDEDINDSMKKAKTDESYGLLNTSLDYLRSLRKPVQVSTPNSHGYKFNIDEKKATNDDQTIVMEETAEPKKWCIIM